MKKIDLIKEYVVYYIIRILLIVLYPLWLFFTLAECKTKKEFIEGAKIPFKKWGEETKNE